MTFTLTIRTDGAAFEDDPTELARILRTLLDTGCPTGTLDCAGTLHDVNGNMVGAWKVSDE